MTRSFLMFAASGLLAMTFTGNAVADGGDWCDWRLRSSTCGESCYYYVSPAGPGTEANCDMMAMVGTQDDYFAAPAEPSLTCSRSDGGYLCQAWPQGEEISYAWYDNSPVTANARNPYRFVGCGSTVDFAVIGPSGAASTASATMPSCN